MSSPGMATCIKQGGSSKAAFTRNKTKSLEMYKEKISSVAIDSSVFLLFFFQITFVNLFRESAN